MVRERKTSFMWGKPCFPLENAESFGLFLIRLSPVRVRPGALQLFHMTIIGGTLFRDEIPLSEHRTHAL
jgi:hypothetical protein